MSSARRFDDPRQVPARAEAQSPPAETAVEPPNGLAWLAPGVPGRGADVARQRGVLALQSQAGNQAVQRLLRRDGGAASLLRNPVAYTGTAREEGGQVNVTVESGKVTADGTVMRPAAEGAAPAPTPVSGSLTYAVDDRDPTRFVIGTMKSTPKRTGVGMLLVYHMAKDAKARGATTIGTDLSALEEGTPEFYMALGLQPSPERVQIAAEAVSDMPTRTREERTARERQRKNIMYSAALNGSVDGVLARSYQSASEKWVAGTLSQRFSNWWSTPKLPVH